MSSKTEQAIADVFNRYDTNKTGFIEKEELRNCIHDLNGRNLDDVELGHIMDLLGGAKDGKVTLEAFTKVMETFFKYC